MRFRWFDAPDGTPGDVERLGAWETEADISDRLLRLPHPRFVAHGDGLITFRCADETATYGITDQGMRPSPSDLERRAITGQGDIADEAFFHIRLLNVRPTSEEQD